MINSRVKIIFMVYAVLCNELSISKAKPIMSEMTEYDLNNLSDRAIKIDLMKKIILLESTFKKFNHLVEGKKSDRIENVFRKKDFQFEILKKITFILKIFLFICEGRVVPCELDELWDPTLAC